MDKKEQVSEILKQIGNGDITAYIPEINDKYVIKREPDYRYDCDVNFLVLLALILFGIITGVMFYV